jgi:hypothetical protein
MDANPDFPFRSSVLRGFRNEIPIFARWEFNSKTLIPLIDQVLELSLAGGQTYAIPIIFSAYLGIEAVTDSQTTASLS